MSHFIHPYNFVRVPRDGLALAGKDGIADDHLFLRQPPAGHERFDSGRFTGYLDCVLTTRTEWFIPDPRKLAEHPSDPRHKILGYFTLDEVPNWSFDHPESDTTRPAIPASSLRGMVRSVFEAATLSCFSVFDPGRLQFRAPGLLEGHDAKFIPARVIERSDPDGPVRILLLDGRIHGIPGVANDPSNTVRAAIHRSYFRKVIVKDRDGTQRAGEPTGIIASHPEFRDGSPVVAVVTRSALPFHGGNYHAREAVAVYPADEASRGTIGAAIQETMLTESQFLVLGYLHRTGPNIENKHDERVFFRANAPYNHPSRGHATADLIERFTEFDNELRDVRTADVTIVDRSVVDKADELLEGYRERHEAELDESGHPPPPRKIGTDPDRLPRLSDFIVNDRARMRIKQGDLLYALLDNARDVKGLYPVAMPRMFHRHSRGELLPSDFHPCGSDDDRDPRVELCPACRVFGWVRENSNRLEPDSTRVDAVAGNVRFTHGELVGLWGDGPARRASRVSLPVLGSPKPTCAEFYLQPIDGAPANRWPSVLNIRKLLPFAMYRSEEAWLRGRKFYRRRSSTKAQLSDMASNGLKRPPDDKHAAGHCDSQNQSVHLLPKDMQFNFRVYFDNLTEPELGALAFALELNMPSNWPDADKPRQHALGRGKPLGMGGCTIRVTHLHSDDFATDGAAATHRYRRAPDWQSLLAPNPAQPDGPSVDRFINALATAWNSACAANPALAAVRDDLIEMLRVDSFDADPDNASIHYPPRWRPPEPGQTNAAPLEFYDSFSWFVANRRGDRKSHRESRKRRLPDPHDERTGTDRLPVDPTTPTSS